MVPLGGKESACNVETQVRFLGQEDPLEKRMATHSSILAWKITQTEEPGGLQRVGHDYNRSPDTFQTVGAYLTLLILHPKTYCRFCIFMTVS